jgi:hypothetical protein
MLRGRPLRVIGVPILALTLFSASEYRGHLTDEGSRRVAPVIGENVEQFDGRIVTVLDTAYLVAMSATLKRTEQRRTVWTGEQLMIPRSAVNRFELRQLDRPRTIRAAALYGGGMLAIGVLVFSIKSLSSGSGTVTPPPPPP